MIGLPKLALLISISLEAKRNSVLEQGGLGLFLLSGHFPFQNNLDGLNWTAFGSTPFHFIIFFFHEKFCKSFFLQNSSVLGRKIFLKVPFPILSFQSLPQFTPQFPKTVIFEYEAALIARCWIMLGKSSCTFVVHPLLE